MSAGPSHTSHNADGRYRSFLLRCWREPGGEEGVASWRFSVTEVDGDRPRWGCEGLDELLVLLGERLAAGPAGQSRPVVLEMDTPVEGEGSG